METLIQSSSVHTEDVIAQLTSPSTVACAIELATLLLCSGVDGTSLEIGFSCVLRVLVMAKPGLSMIYDSLGVGRPSIGTAYAGMAMFGCMPLPISGLWLAVLYFEVSITKGGCELKRFTNLGESERPVIQTPGAPCRWGVKL